MPIVYCNRTENRPAFVRKVLETLAPDIRSAHTIFVKVNLVSYEPYPTTTHPDTLRAVLEWLAGRDVVVGDAPAIDAPGTAKIINASLLKQVCDARGVPFVNLYKTEAMEFVSRRGYSFHVFTLPLERDWVISLPVLKSHIICQMTGALKNGFGYLPRRERVAMHVGAKDIHKGIAEVAVVAKPNLVIMDGVQTLVDAQELRWGGEPRHLGYMLASTDPVAVDCLGLRLLQEVEPRLRGKSPADIRHLKYAMEYGVGSPEFEVQEIAL